MNTQLSEKDRKVLDLIKAGMRRRGASESEIAETEKLFKNSKPHSADLDIIDDSILYEEVSNPKGRAATSGRAVRSETVNPEL